MGRLVYSRHYTTCQIDTKFDGAKATGERWGRRDVRIAYAGAGFSRPEPGHHRVERGVVGRVPRSGPAGSASTIVERNPAYGFKIDVGQRQPSAGATNL